MDISKIKRGDQITFTSPTLHSGAPKLTRVVRRIDPLGRGVEVNAHGWDCFLVRPSEIEAHMPKGGA